MNIFLNFNLLEILGLNHLLQKSISVVLELFGFNYSFDVIFFLKSYSFNSNFSFLHMKIQIASYCSSQLQKVIPPILINNPFI